MAQKPRIHSGLLATLGMKPYYSPGMAQLVADVESSLARRIGAAPQLFASNEADARVAGWLADIAGDPAGRTLKRLVGEHPMLASLLAGIAEGSPYLWELARADPVRLAVLLMSDPERRFKVILADAACSIAASHEAAIIFSPDKISGSSRRFSDCT